MKNIFEFDHHKDLLDLFHSAYKDGLEGAVFQLFTSDCNIGDSLIVDLIKSGKLENNKIASSIYGYNYKKIKSYDRFFYDMAKFAIEKSDSEEVKNISNAIIENVIISDQIKLFKLIDNKISSAAMGREWINILYEIIFDKTDKNYWDTDNLAFGILAFIEAETDRFKNAAINYKSFYNANKLDAGFIVEIENGNNTTFDTLMQNVVHEKIDAANHYLDILNENQLNLIRKSIEFIKS